MGDNMDKKITVIVTIYNTPEKYLKKCIDSIIKQTFKEIEIILVNDGSDKKTSEICRQYKDERIKLIEQKNMGESVARNVGIENAATENIISESQAYAHGNYGTKVKKAMEFNAKGYNITIVKEQEISCLK